MAEPRGRLAVHTTAAGVRAETEVTVHVHPRNREPGAAAGHLTLGPVDENRLVIYVPDSTQARRLADALATLADRLEHAERRQNFSVVP